MAASLPAPCVAILGTCDTKLEELLYVHTRLLRTHHVRVKLVDVGRTPSTHPDIDIQQSAILAHRPSSTYALQPSTPPDLSKLSRNDVITTLSERTGPFLSSLITTQDIHGCIALGGSGGSSLAAGVFRALPLGFPKLLVSTMAAGDVGPFVGDADVALIYSVVDIAGLNDILCPILDNAAAAVAGMASVYQTRLSSLASEPAAQGSLRQKRVAITMFGVTTPAVTHARALLTQHGCTSYVFHATGAGGRSLERLAAEHFFDGVLDLTTTELADELVGGVLSAGPHRLEAAARAGVPQVVSLGALDMVNFGPRASVPGKWAEPARGRKLFVHNPSVTLMRTTREECAELGRAVVRKLRAAGARPDRTEVWIPRGGVSALSVQGAPFADPEADEALFRELRDGLEAPVEGGGRIRVVETAGDINDPKFVEGAVSSLLQMMSRQSGNNEM